MKYKTAELEGALLDAAVAKAEGVAITMPDNRGNPCVMAYQVDSASGPSDDLDGDRYTPSDRWDHAGPIIQRERIGIEYWVMLGERYWGAGLKDEKGHELPDLDPAKHAEMANGWCPVMATGPTPLIAAMRCYVTSKLGDEVELP
jgi:hypothetical protein